MRILPLLLAAFFLPAIASAESIQVATGLLPHKSIIQQIGGERVKVTTVVGEGQDPHSFQMTPKQMLNLGSSDVYFISGMPFEDSLSEKLAAANADLRVVNLLHAAFVRQFSAEEAHSHDHHDHKDHDHDHEDHDHGEGSTDPHAWLAPLGVIQQAAEVRATLTEIDPEGANLYEANFTALEKQMTELHAELVEKLKPLEGSRFHVFHPAFGYFADAYGLTQVAIEEDGRSPDPKTLFKLIESAKEEGVGVIFVQPQFSDASARRIADSVGASIVSLDPLDPDIQGNLRAIAGALLDAHGS